jgi:hypothetical protein
VPPAGAHRLAAPARPASFHDAFAGDLPEKDAAVMAVAQRPVDPFLMPPGTPHNALDTGPGTGHMLSTYIVEAGEPLATLVDGPPAAVVQPP